MFKEIIGLTNVAMYLRKSRADQEAEARGEGETLSKHKRELLKLAETHRIYLNQEDIFEEIVSGEKIAYRPQMILLLEKVEKGDFKAVLCVDIDRLGRGNMIDQGTIQDIFKKSKTLIVTLRKVYDLNNELDEEWTEFESFMARRELKIITRRMQRGRLQSVREGKFLGAHTPFGYDKGENCILIPNEDARIVQMIFNWYVYGDEDGNSMGSTKISNRLNQLGRKSPLCNKAWTASTILSVLKNEVYIGKIQWRKTFRNKKEGIGHKRDRAEWVDVEGKHEPIVSEELFNQAKVIMSRNLNPKNSTKNPRNPFAGLLICGGCGHHMVMQVSTGKRYENVPVEQRLKMLKCVAPLCNFPSSSFKYVEEKILIGLQDYLKDLKIDEEMLTEAMKQREKVNPYTRLISDAEKKLNELLKQVDKLDTLLERGLYDADKYKGRSARLVEEIISAKSNLEQLKESDESFIAKHEQVKKQIRSITDVIEAYNATKDISLKNRLLKSIIDSVYYIREPKSKRGEFEIRLMVKKL